MQGPHGAEVVDKSALSDTETEILRITLKHTEAPLVEFGVKDEESFEVLASYEVTDHDIEKHIKVFKKVIDMFRNDPVLLPGFDLDAVSEILITIDWIEFYIMGSEERLSRSAELH